MSQIWAGPRHGFCRDLLWEKRDLDTLLDLEGVPLLQTQIFSFKQHQALEECQIMGDRTEEMFKLPQGDRTEEMFKLPQGNDDSHNNGTSCPEDQVQTVVLNPAPHEPWHLQPQVTGAILEVLLPSTPLLRLCVKMSVGQKRVSKMKPWQMKPRTQTCGPPVVERGPTPK